MRIYQRHFKALRIILLAGTYCYVGSALEIGSPTHWLDQGEAIYESACVTTHCLYTQTGSLATSHAII